MSDTKKILPKGWDFTTIGDISEVILGQSPPSSTYNENSKGLPFYQGKYEFGTIYPTTRKWCTEPKKIAEKGDVLISVRAPVGPTNICTEKSCIGRGLAAIRGLSGINTLFILYLIRSHEIEIAVKGTGTTFNAISGDQLRDFEILLPPLAEQHRIVAKIEELFTRIDSGVKSLEKVQVQLERYRQAVLKAAFEGTLTQDWREDNIGKIESASILFERIKSKYNYNEKEIENRLQLNESELFKIPNEWRWVQVQDVCYNITNGYTPSADKLFENSGEIPFIKVYNLTKTGAFDFTKKPTFISRITHETELKRSAVYPNDVLMNIVGPPLGKISLIPELYNEWNINQAIVIYRTFPEYSRKLILYVLLSETIQKWLQKRGKTTAGQTNYTITMSRSLPIPLPPLKEQSVIVNEIERHFYQIDYTENAVETSLKLADSLRTSILKCAFEGKLVPQDPSDEPASKLLERIRAERAKNASVSKSSRTLKTKVKTRQNVLG